MQSEEEQLKQLWEQNNYKQYDRLVEKIYGVERLVPVTETKGKCGSKKRTSLKVISLDSRGIANGDKIEPIKYLDKGSLNED